MAAGLILFGVGVGAGGRPDRRRQRRRRVEQLGQLELVQAGRHAAEARAAEPAGRQHLGAPGAGQVPARRQHGRPEPGQISADGRKDLRRGRGGLGPLPGPEPGEAGCRHGGGDGAGLHPRLNQAAKAADAQEIVTGAHPNRNAYLNLAKLAYAAGQTRKGDLAAQKALAETPKDLRTAVEDQLDQAKKQGAAAAGGQTSPAPAPTTSTG